MRIYDRKIWIYTGIPYAVIWILVTNLKSISNSGRIVINTLKQSGFEFPNRTDFPDYALQLRETAAVQRRIGEICAGLSPATLRTMARSAGRLHISAEHRVAYCPVYKIATTTLSHFFIRTGQSNSFIAWYVVYKQLPRIWLNCVNTVMTRRRPRMRCWWSRCWTPGLWWVSWCPLRLSLPLPWKTCILSLL